MCVSILNLDVLFFVLALSPWGFLKQKVKPNCQEKNVAYRKKQEEANKTYQFCVANTVASCSTHLL